MMTQITEQFWLFGGIFVISGLAGLAALLRTDRVLDWRKVSGAILNSGLLGVAMGLMWYKVFYPDNLWLLIGLTLLAGLGGMGVFGFFLELVRKGGIGVDVVIKPKKRR
jgi:hypothetical protein